MKLQFSDRLEIEKQWAKEAWKFSNECISDLVHVSKNSAAVSGYIVGIKDYKAALRREIERIYAEDHPKRGYVCFTKAGLLDIIDTVSPE